jgi:hypothetical protein
MRRIILIAVGCMIFAWLPYVSLKLYWLSLLRTVPGAEHGEVSGPIGYFLPRLLIAAVAATIAVAIGSVVAIGKLVTDRR